MELRTQPESSVVLIGMPGAGKSTLGKDLAKDRRVPLIDTDSLIEQHTGKKLQQLLDERGYQALRELEGEIITKTEFASPCVIATGGSVVYSEQAMGHLKASAVCVFFMVSLETVKARVKNLERRGFVRAPGQSLAEVYEERQPLYERFADVVLPCDHLSRKEILAQLKLLLLKLP